MLLNNIIEISVINIPNKGVVFMGDKNPKKAPKKKADKKPASNSTTNSVSNVVKKSSK